MRSRTEPFTRAWFERALRVLAFAALGAALLETWRADAAPRTPAVAEPLPPAEGLAARLVETARGPVTVTLADVPEAERRALLQAGREAGVSVAWTPARALPPLAVAVDHRADPDGGTRVRVAADSGRRLVLEDTLGWLDSAQVDGPGVTWTVEGAPRPFTVRAGGTIARADGSAAPDARRLRLLAAPGWEARFAVVALEESGWRVDAAFDIAPRVTVRAGEPARLDTSRYAAVIALDSTAWRDAAAIAQFVRAGGGLVLAGEAARGAPGSLPRAGTSARPSPGIPGALRTTSPVEGLALHPIARLEPGAVVLERSTRPGAPVSVAARRVGAGRVVQAGWQGTWEWRMLGGDDAVDAHRAWWRAQVARAIGGAGQPAAVWQPYPGDAAPLADLVARLGPAGPVATDDGAGLAPAVTPRAPSPWWLLTAAGALLVEWWSRRLRGAR